MIEPEPLASAGDLTLVRWCDPALPERLSALTAEAVAGGVEWMNGFPTDWSGRPFTEPGEGLFLAMQDTVPVAMAVISADPHTQDTDTGRLRYIYVGTAARGQGLMRMLVEACLDRGRHRWCRVRLHTDNPVAARIYERYGFTPVSDETRSTHRRDGML